MRLDLTDAESVRAAVREKYAAVATGVAAATPIAPRKYPRPMLGTLGHPQRLREPPAPDLHKSGDVPPTPRTTLARARRHRA